MNEEKTKEIRDRIKTHRAMIESLRIQLKDVEDNKPYGSMKELYLKTMKGMTSPFANYNKNVSSYLKDPDLHRLKGSLNKAKKFMLKVLKEGDKLIVSLSKISKKIEKLSKIEKAIIENPAHIKGFSQSKDTVNELNTLKEWLEAQRTAILTGTIDPQDGVSEAKATEQLIRTFEKHVTSDS